ncbi:MAG: long-chain fatty acid--CoA ligase [Actinobacteria bacterium]|nr:MAG: long-chain fatty acid--CoA ligase [Actinomycetota bacterium]
MEVTTTERERVVYKALQEPTLCAAFQVTAAEHPDRVALRTKGDEFSMTWAEYRDKITALAGGLAGLGLGRGDTIALLLTNRPEFHWVDAAAMHLGATPFSVYNTYSAEQIEFLVSDAQNAIIVTEAQYLDTIAKVREACSSVEHVVVVDEPREGTLSLDDVEGRAEEGFDFEAAWKAVQPDDVLTLIYTSGTTGPPKGVQITHENELSAGRSFDQIIQFPDGARAVSYLPMAHIAERSCTHYLPIMFGFTVTCCPDARQVISYLPEVKPSWFFAVPRIFEKLKAAMEAGMEAEQDEERKKFAKHALEVGLKKVRLEQSGEEVPDDLREEFEKLDEQVFSKIRAGLGLDEIEALNVGAAPTPREVIEFFHAIGLPLAELWGMSETCGAGTCNRPEHIKIGTVGPPAPGIEVKLADDGEVLVRGGVVMKGYRNQPEKTKETFDEDGFLLTGDIGEFDEDGFLKIVDRKKELIINAAGKNMSPANIEAKLKTASPLIGQAIAIGDARPYNVALVTLDPDSVPGFAREHGLEGEPIEKLAGEEAVIAAVQEGVNRANEQLARVEQIKKFKILPTDWEPGGDELTPTMKLKRKPIVGKYQDEIEALYAK